MSQSGQRLPRGREDVEQKGFVPDTDEVIAEREDAMRDRARQFRHRERRPAPEPFNEPQDGELLRGEGNREMDGLRRPRPSRGGRLDIARWRGDVFRLRATAVKR